MNDFSFSDKSVIITGASRGIGKALALCLADEGAWVALAARDAGSLSAVAAECEKRGGRALAVPTDVAQEEGCQALIERTVEEFGRLDMLVNNAGMGMVGRLVTLPDLKLWRRVFDVNYYGTLYCTYHALPHLEAQQGRIVNMSSLAGLLAIPYNTAYVASKFAMIGFSDALRLELARSGVSVTVVSPFWVATEFEERLLDRQGQPRGARGRPAEERRGMSAQRCAEITLEAARRRKRHVVMWPGPLMLRLKLIAPALVDRLVVSILLRHVGASTITKLKT